MTFLKTAQELHKYLENFRLNTNLDSLVDKTAISPSRKTMIEEIVIKGIKFKKYINEFWTSKQRQASSIHEISYRACFKPQLPRFFIKLLSKKEDIIYDPFSGRGTSVIEAGLLGRNIISNDINPLSKILIYPRFFIPHLAGVKERLGRIPIKRDLKADIDLSMFYHPKTEAELVSIKEYLAERKERGKEDNIDRWIRMVATNRLTGHSKGFFSVYTLPPNQAVSPERQIKINKKLNQEPEYRDTRQLILRKTKALLKRISAKEKENLRNAGKGASFCEKDARDTPEIASENVSLTITSPPFLNIVQYAKDNWLRCWFNSIDIKELSERITLARSIQDWSDFIGNVLKELYRVTRPGGWLAFEVGEIKKGKIKLDEVVVPLGIDAGFKCMAILINSQKFTKTANIWGVNNMDVGTNTNRIVIFKKEK
ncbi:MAG: DNA methyltransferase [Promethearchaeota archaeon]